jgi:hypothetical protein
VRAKPFSKAECKTEEEWVRRHGTIGTGRETFQSLFATIRSLRRELALVRRGYWKGAECPIDSKYDPWNRADAIRDRREGKK